MTEKIIKNKEYKPRPLDDVPGFVYSFTNSPAKEIINKKSIYTGYIRLVDVIDDEITIPMAVFDPWSPIGYVSGYAEREVKFKKRRSTPFIFSYFSVFNADVIISEPKVGESSFMYHGYNSNTFSDTVIKIRFYLYEISSGRAYE